MKNIKSIIVRHILALALAMMALQFPSYKSTKAQELFVPNFWNPDERFTPPAASQIGRLRFLTTTDFPPFNFIDRNKRLTGFHVELARAICEKLQVLEKCQIQALPWNELQKALEKGEAEAIIAGLEASYEARKKFDFSKIYLKIPARFVTLSSNRLEEPIIRHLKGRTVGVVNGSRHAQFFKTFFLERKSLAFPTRRAALNALKSGQVDAVFTDAISASFWLASADAANCCSFSGQAYLSEKYITSNLAIAVKKGDEQLVNGLNFALKAINDDRTFEKLYLKYFPSGLF